MTAYAVRGLDINTSYTIYHLLNEQKKKGVAVIYVGEDLDVLLELCDRILVLCGGKVNGIVDGRKTTKEEVGLLMTNLSERRAGMSQMHTADREPLLRIVKREGIHVPAWRSRVRAIAILLALVVDALFIYVRHRPEPAGRLWRHV